MITKTQIKPLVSHLVKGDNHLWLALDTIDGQISTIIDQINETEAEKTKPPTTVTPTGLQLIIDSKTPGGKPAPVLTARSDQKWEVDIYYHVVGATTDNFTGVAVYLEDPDISARPNIQLNGTAPLDGSRGAAGKWQPKFENNVTPDIAAVSAPNPYPITVIVDGLQRQRYIRIYLAVYGPNSDVQLVRANQTNPTPNVQVLVPVWSLKYVRGQEYAWLVSNVHVDVEPDFNRPDPNYKLEFSYTPPDPSIPLPPGMNPFGGVEIYYTYPDAKNTDPLYVITDSAIFVPETSSNGYLSPTYDVGSGGTFRVYFCSGDNSQPAHVNTLIPGVTPYQSVTIAYTTLVPDVTNFHIVKSYMTRPYDGSLIANLDIAWTNPTIASYGGVRFYLTGISPADPAYTVPRQLAEAGSGATSGTLSVSNWPTTLEHWTITAISEDSFQKENNIPQNPRPGSPQVIWDIGGPIGLGGLGHEYAPLVTPLNLPTPVVDQQVSNDGVQMMRFTISGWTIPTDTAFGGAKVAMVDGYGTTYYDAGKNTTLTTPWLTAAPAETIYFYVVSYDPQNNINHIDFQPGGSTPFTKIDFVPTPGKIKASQIPTDWFSTADFVWKNAPGPFNPADPTNTGLQIAQLDAGRVQVGSVLRVGGAPPNSSLAPSFRGQNGQIAVYSSGIDPGDISGTPTLRAWMGQQYTALPDGTSATVYGGWFSELYVGGQGPPTSPLYVKNGGLMILGGWDVQTVLSTKYYPYLTVRDKRNTDQARIGASIAANPDGTRQVPVGDIADIGGGWFSQFAVGPNLAHWQILAPGDQTLRMRQINTFEIDYVRNISTISPPLNAPYQLLLGTDVAYTVIGSTKFPGIVINRWDDIGNKATSHSSILINRGLVLSTDDSFTAEKRRAALVTFNGDQNGYDSGRFWGELSMYSPTTGVLNVLLNSGYIYNGVLSGNASFQMGDENGNLSFQVRQSRDIVLGAQVFWGSSASIQLIDASGNYIGPIKTAYVFSAPGYNVGATTIINGNGDYKNGNFDSGPNYFINAGKIGGTLFSVSGWNGGPPGLGNQVISNDGHWTGQPITGGQTPWTQTIYAAGNDLRDVTNIFSRLGSYVLTDNPYGGQHVLTVSGPGIVIQSSGGYFPKMDLQPSSITMLNSGGSQVFHVDLNGVLTCSTCNNGIWTGSLQTGIDYVMATQFVIYGQGFFGTTPVTFTTVDGKTVTVIGGIITKIV
jgi:hypothetical protein